MKKLLSFVAALAAGLVVAGTSQAEAATYYFDNTATAWDNVSVWSWSVDDADPLFQMQNELSGWPGKELSKDDATGYYVWECKDPAAGTINVMFNNGGEGVDATAQTCDALAMTAVDGKVCTPTVENTADDETADANRKAGQWFGEWKDVAAKEEAPAPEDKPEDNKEETPAPEDNKEEVTPDAGKDEVTPDAGKDEVPATGDVAPIAAVAVLAVASMAVVVATKKRMA